MLDGILLYCLVMSLVLILHHHRRQPIVDRSLVGNGFIRIGLFVLVVGLATWKAGCIIPAPYKVWLHTHKLSNWAMLVGFALWVIRRITFCVTANPVRYGPPEKAGYMASIKMGMPLFWTILFYFWLLGHRGLPFGECWFRRYLLPG